jgi:exopolyphosphatase/guanosine-5'-triphosphate,3'-diphosphate pyrophosphatase
MSGSTNGNAPLAAVDLGSNSFHLLIAREMGGHLAVIDRLRDPVRLAAGLDGDGVLEEKAQERLFAALKRFRQRLGEIDPERVRAVGTDTFRRVKQPKDLLARASAALGFPIEVLPGGEEARLIWLGVAHEEPAIEGRRLVIDIGGGSTECILGKRFTPLVKDSLAMGCVNYTRRFFAEGELTRKAFKKAEIAASLELETLQRRYRESGWEECVGASGTMTAVAELVQAQGWSEGTVTLAHVKDLRRLLMAAERVERLTLPGLSSDRAQVLAAGLSILEACFEVLEIETLRASKAALREGALWDLLGRIRHEDVRDRTIRVLSERYHVDVDQAERVERTAKKCLEQVAKAWKLEDESCARWLEWAARMHELGLAVSHSGYHKHGGYILENSDMPGFSRQDQLRLAALVRGHRRKLLRAPLSELFGPAAETVLRLTVLLRLAARLHRPRSPGSLPRFQLRVTDKGLELGFSATYLEKNTLIVADLEEEAEQLAEAGVELEVVRA